MFKTSIDKTLFLELLSQEKSEELSEDIVVTDESELDYDIFGPDVKFRFPYKTLVDGKIVTKYVTRNDMNIALSKYAEDQGYDLYNYRFLGGVKMEGLFLRRYVPHFDGISLKLMERQNVRSLKKHQ